MAHEIWAHFTHVVKTRKIMNKLQKENNLPKFPKPSRRFQRAGTPHGIFLRGFWNRNLDMSIACWQCSWYKEQMSSPPPTQLWLPVFLISSAWWTVQLQEFRQKKYKWCFWNRDVLGDVKLHKLHNKGGLVRGKDKAEQAKPNYDLFWEGNLGSSILDK